MTIRSSQFRSRAGFTMLEILVTVGIIITLISLAVYGLAAAKKAARRAETVARLGAISNALTQYHSDFGTYPPSYSAGFDGSQMLSQALLGWSTTDGEAGFGFRLNTGGQGKIYGPYLPPDPKTFYANATPASGNVFIDANGNSILYYKAIPARRGTVARTAVAKVFGASTVDPMDNASVNDATFRAIDGVYQTNDNKKFYTVTGGKQALATLPDNSADDQKAFRKLLGDLNGDNSITAGELIIGSDSFLLVAPGEDGLYFNGDDVISGAK